MLYNAAHRYYVLIVSLASLDRSRAEVGWAVSVSPYGPFKLDGARCAGHRQVQRQHLSHGGSTTSS